MEKRKMKMWKKILIIIAVLLLIFIALTIRKMIILDDLNSKISKYIDSENAYVKVSSDEATGLEYIETYKKEDVIKTAMKKRNEEVYLTEFETPTQRKVYTVIPEKKIVSTYERETVWDNRQIIINNIPSGGFIQNFMTAMFSHLRSEKLDGKECYILGGLYNSNLLYVGGTTKVDIYIEKDTGLTLKMITYKKNDGEETKTTVTYEYKFNEVTDEDMKEPDEAEYIKQ